jgi:predicted metal-dependent hydrolase
MSPSPARSRPSILQQLALQFELPLFTREPGPRPLVPPPPLTSLHPTTPVAPHTAQLGPPADFTLAPAEPTLAPGEQRRQILLGQQVLSYILRRSRRRSIGFAIGEHGLLVTAPKWVPLYQIEESVTEKQRWILAKLGEMHTRRQDVPKVIWQDGGVLPYLGVPLTLRIAHGGSPRIDVVRLHAEANELHIALPPSASTQQLKDRVQSWMQNEARRLFTERLEVYGARLGIRHRVLRLSSAGTRWGSCHADGKILLNWRLVHFPLSSIDYVVAHELAHLKEMNHGPRFWRTVAEMLPGFESARDHLKHPPPELLPKF